MAAGTREIDKLPLVTERPVEMQVLCLGLSRTSTMSMLTAFTKLGYNCYHFLEAARMQTAGERHLDYWLEGFKIKMYGNGEPFGRSEFDKILGDYSAVTDTPCANFCAELIAAYPDAKIILKTRDPDKWVQSMEVSVLNILSWRIWPFLMKYGVRKGPKALRNLLELAVLDWTSGHPDDREALRAGFLAHNQRVRSLAPKYNFLEFSVTDGWEPLCKFLGKEVPNEPFPHVNKGSNAASMVAAGLVIGYVRLIWKPILVAVAAWLAYKWIPR